MPLPSFRSSRSKVRRRRSHHALKAVIIDKCKGCNADIVAHHACRKCGLYNGRTTNGGMDAVEKKLKKAPTAKAEAAEVAPKKAAAKKPRAKKAVAEEAPKAE